MPPPLSRREELIGLALVVISATGYALVPILLKLSYTALPSWGPLDIVTWRFLLATALIWPLAAWRGQANWREQWPNGGRQMLLAGLIYTANSVLAFTALTRIPAALYSLLLYLYPAMVAILGAFLGARLSRAGWGAVALALLGCALTVGARVDLGETDPVGVAMAFACAVVYAIYIIFSGRHTARLPQMASGAWSMTGTMLGVLLLTLVRGGLPLPPGPGGWLVALLISTFGAVVPIVTFLAGMERLGPARAAILSTVEPVITIAVAALLLGERIAPSQLVGGALILASVIWLQRSRQAG